MDEAWTGVVVEHVHQFVDPAPKSPERRVREAEPGGVIHEPVRIMEQQSGQSLKPRPGGGRTEPGAGCFVQTMDECSKLGPESGPIDSGEGRVNHREWNARDLFLNDPVTIDQGTVEIRRTMPGPSRSST
jgi:hypothetical protein